MITREILETRMKEMTAARTKHQSDVDANTGAIQLCLHLLANLDRAESDAKTGAVVTGYKATPRPAPKGKAKPNGGKAAGP